MSDVLSKIKGQSSSSSGEKPRKLAIIASKGSLDMAYPPLILANAARMSGIECDIFFTFWGLDLVSKKKIGKVNISTVGNPAFSMAPYAPWFKIPTWLGIIPGMSKVATWMMGREIAKLDFPPIPEFMELVADAGVKLYGCLMSMDMMGLEEEDLIDGATALGAMEFMELTEGAQVLFV
ncbi:MAG: DsrE/DsrF/DrsH-like family protein [Chloroflexota bacterium]